jgi:TolB-like protein/class 3 adenylate cyclase
MPDRRLAAILAADVAGYSTLVEKDEDGTLAALRAIEGDVIQPTVTAHGGRIFKRMGDGYLVEFASVVQAVECARAWQDGAKGPLLFRIGIHLGDVVVDGEDLHGAGVNIAARIEGLAEPGGICLSREARDQVRDRLKVVLEDLGPLEVKNIERPVRVFRVTGEDRPQRQRSGRKGVRWPAVAGAAVLLAATALGLWFWQPWIERVTPADPARMALALPDRPSVAVLPFENLTEGGDQEYFATGITEDIITDLAKISGLFVIARESSFTFAGKTVEIRGVAEELGVRYVLQGSVRRAGDTMRITAHLIDALTGRHIWADRFDRDTSDIFEVQSEVARQVAKAMEVTLTANENERLYQKYVANIEAYEVFLEAKRTVDAPLRENILRGEELFRRVIELDPNFAGGYAGLAFNLAVQVRFQYSDDPAGDLAEAFANAEKAVALDPRFAWGHIALGGVYIAEGNQDAAVAAVREALALEPSGYEANLFAGYYLQFAGHAQEGVEHLLIANRLSPVTTVRDIAFLAYARFMNGNYLETIRLFEEMNRRFPRAMGPRNMTAVAAAYALLDRSEEAAAAADWIRSNHPDFSLSEWRFIQGWKRPEDRARLYDAAKRAGVPEFPQQQ